MQIEPQHDGWVTVDLFFHPTDAHIAAGRVESEGIPVFLLGINHASVNWLLSIALGGIQLQVPAQFVADARTMLTEFGPGEDNSEDQCPECASTNIWTASISWKIAFLAIHLFSLPVPWRNKKQYCSSCGAKWDVEDDI